MQVEQHLHGEQLLLHKPYTTETMNGNKYNNKITQKYRGTFTYTPQGKGTYQIITNINTGIHKTRIRSIIVNSGGTNAGAFVNWISDNGLISITIFQGENISLSSMTGSVTVYYE